MQNDLKQKICDNNQEILEGLARIMLVFDSSHRVFKTLVRIKSKFEDL